MSEQHHHHPIFQLLKRDPRYKLEAYQFVRDALSYAHDELGMGQAAPSTDSDDPQTEAHLTGQQLCEAIRVYAIEQFGLMSRVVLNNWGITRTGDFGEIVYNLIDIGLMKKSESDRREDFDDVYSFDEAFNRHFKITRAE
jgi:uncharacterized repeat protein (TIGR04138 family)